MYDNEKCCVYVPKKLEKSVVYVVRAALAITSCISFCVDLAPIQVCGMGVLRVH